jgi:hypothetical protein
MKPVIAMSLSFIFSESGVHSGSAVRPIPKWQRPLLALHRLWQRTLLRLLLAECCNFFLRMGFVLRTAKHGSPEKFGQGPSDHRLTLACNDDMIELQASYPWAGLLDVQLACQAWVLGVEAAHRISRNEESNTAPIVS